MTYRISIFKNKQKYDWFDDEGHPLEERLDHIKEWLSRKEEGVWDIIVKSYDSWKKATLVDNEWVNWTTLVSDTKAYSVIVNAVHSALDLEKQHPEDVAELRSKIKD